MNKLTLLIISFSFAFFNVANASSTVKIKVIDDENSPVEGASVEIFFMNNDPEDDFLGYTGGDGRAQATGNPIWGSRIYVEKQGSYKTKVKANNDNHDRSVILRKMINPVPMYARTMELKLPEKGKVYGFDFEQGDLVVPYGSGIKNHIFFSVEGNRQDVTNYDEKFKVSFSSIHDGIKKYGSEEEVYGSEFKFPYSAPVNGYKNQLDHSAKATVIEKKYRREMFTEETYDRFILGYVFRVNTKVDAEGNTISANYGKIRGEIEGDTNSKGGGGYVRFTYYYNPVANERSLEFDPKRNLFTNLNQQENVREP